jgi:bifunctional non-homologous end joining protein LigD
LNLLKLIPRNVTFVMAVKQDRPVRLPFPAGGFARLSEQYPDRYLAKMSKAARRGKIFIDYLRNDRGATAIAPFSTRAKPGAPISVPITWKELSADLRSDQWRIENIDERLKKKKDPWAGLFEVKQHLPKMREPMRQLIPKD